MGSGIDDPAFKRVVAMSLPVNAYYAMYNAWRALALARGSKSPTHKSFHDDFAGSRRQLPLPWCIEFDGDPKDAESCRVEPSVVEPYAFNLLERSHEPVAYIAGALRTTRKWKLDQARERWLNENRINNRPRRRLPAEARATLLERLRPTTLVDFMYELRRKANYESVDEFRSEVTDTVVGRYHDGLVGLMDSGLAVIESLIMTYVGAGVLLKSVTDWAKGTSKIGAWPAKPALERIQLIADSS